MSYDLNFWSEPKGFESDPLEIYRALSDGSPFDGLYQINVAGFYKRIIEAFPGTKESNGFLDWEGEENSFQVSSSSQHVRVDCYGEPGEWMNVFIDIGKEFSCPLYDPQTDMRFTG
ncbi:hypothetical protein K6Q96_19120 [Grimontia kaedaensis]|uniref:Uncharacterized protein n=1 Tax=Grimontia kaedaensis TaxID=2872157 RepID=A0ABY4X2A2_9GAMM|nr:hypothetical protein [Grimontia kaedaensis]USH05322.1 hypothetical protein K6Q96_19120 [Grimontia kaedaensis]